jgi:folate-binding protein YgfZ
MGAEDWERARITSGRPAAGAELTDDYNPLEAGLYHAVSVNKGCYIGQETIAKVSNRNAVKQQLWGITLTAPASPGSPVTLQGEKIGVVTSYADLQAHGDFALGYIKTKSKGGLLAGGKLEGLKVEVGGQPGTLTEVAYATRDFREGAGPSSSSNGGEAAAAAVAAADAAAKAAAEAAAKAERLKVGDRVACVRG